MTTKASSSKVQAAGTAAALTAELLSELVKDIAIEEYRLALHRRSTTAKLPLPSTQPSEQAQPGVLDLHGNGNGPSPTKKEKDEGLFECCVCSRQIAASRYASHLSGCMGLGGSRRSGARTAISNGRANGFSRPASASSYGSDTDASARANGAKRGANGTPGHGGPKPKKPKPTPLTANGSPIPHMQIQLPHAGSHPLAKTMSLPSSPLTPGAAPNPLQTSGSGRPPPPPPPPAPIGLAAPPMQARKSLPGMNGLPAKSPARPNPLPPLSSPAHAALQNNHAQKSPRPPVPQSSAAAAASASPINADALNSDRPESDSENSDDEAPPTATAPIPQKMPRQGMPTAMEMRRSMTGGSAAQKVPRKAMGSTPRKSVAKAMADMGSSEEDASGVSDSD